MPDGPDPKALAERQFATDEGLEGLDILGTYATDPPLAVGALLDAVRPDAPGARVCELGFGSGWLLEEIARAFPEALLYGLDLSAEYTRLAWLKLGARARISRGDMEAIPFADAAFDVVVTCWTLYFMPDVDAALAEIKRTIRPGGRLVAATVAPDHMHEFDDMSRAVAREVGLDDEITDVALRFDLDSGRRYFERAFPGYELREWRGELALPGPDMLVRFWSSHHPAASLGDRAEAARAAVRRHGERMLASDGKIHITRHDGLFIGRKA